MRHLFASLLCLALFSTSQAAAANRVALVMGNGAYEEATALENPVRDAEAMAAALEALEFDVILRTDVDRRSTDQALGEFISASEGAEIALLFFAGHGIQIGGENFLLPVDVSAESEWSLRSSAIEAQRIISEMERRAGVSIVILDACRDNPLVDIVASSTRSAVPQRGLGRMKLSSRGAIVAFAAAAGDTASDGTGDHSPFTQALLEEIDEPNVEIGLMFRRVAGRVRDETRGDQHPELLVRLVDEVYLNRTEAPAEMQVAAVAEATEETQPEATQVATQESASEENTASDLQRQGAAPGRIDLADRRFFGRRVVHQPAWLSNLTVPEPSGWRSAAPEALTETDENNSFGAAQWVPLAAAVEARIAPRGDYDWFRVEVPSRGELWVEVDPAPPELDLYAQIYSADNAAVGSAQGAAGAGDALVGRFPVPAPGAYWVALWDGSSNAESSVPFNANIDFIPADDPFEPNDTLGAAAPLPAQATVWPTIYPRGDYDWFQVWVPEPGLLQLTASKVPDELDIYFRVLDLNKGSIHGSIGPAREGGDTVADAELPAPGTYLIEVHDGSSNAATVEPFRLDLEFKPVSDLAEPNNTVSEAVIVPATSRREMAIFPRGDYDWLAVDVDHPGELTLLAENSPDNLDVYVRVLNADGQAILGSTGPAREGGDVYTFADLPAPGRYFVELHDGSSNASSPDLLDLELTYLAQPDQYEPNNGPAEAAPLTLGTQTLLNILPRGDYDWFRIEVPIAGELYIELEEVPENLDLYVSVLDANQASISGSIGPPREGAVTEAIVDLPRAGAYYIQIWDGSSNARSIDPALLTTTFTPIAEALEPNDSFSMARPIKLGESYLGNILPKGDYDWYIIEAPRAGTFVVNVDDVDDKLDIYATLYDAEVRGSSAYGPPREGAATEAEFEVPAAGLYRLRLHDGSSNNRSAKPFRFQVDFN